MSLATFLTILRAHFKNILFRWFGKAAIPYKWLIQLTNDCNSRCSNCDIWKINKLRPELKANELSDDELNNLLISSGENLVWLSLSGGEISLYRQFRKLVDGLKNHCPKLRLITFTTNGIETEKIVEIVKSLKTLNCNLFVVVSLDGDEEIHDSTRGVKGNYSLALATRKKISEMGVTCYFGTTLSQANAELWSNGMPKEMKSVSLIHSSGIYGKAVSIEDKSILRGLREIIKAYKIRSLSEFGEYVYLRLGILFLMSERKSLPVQCDALSSSVHIHPDGQVSACMYLPALGNVKEKSIHEILSTPEAALQRKDIAKGNCPKCWMNCYAPHSILQHPAQSAISLARSYFA